MGTPDLRGTQGTFTLFTNDPEELSCLVNGGRIEKVQIENGRAVLRIQGPPNTFRKEAPPATVDVIADVDVREPYARFAIEDRMAIVREGEWSEWLTADFPLLPHLVLPAACSGSSSGSFIPYCRFTFHRSTWTRRSCAAYIAPASYSRDVARRVGRFYRSRNRAGHVGLAAGVFTLAQFLSQTRLVFDDERKLLHDSLARFEGVCCSSTFPRSMNWHILWGQHDAELLDLYRGVDECVGEVVRKQPSADVFVMSDHGFTTFSRAVNLNTWLYNRGFLALTGAPGDGVTDQALPTGVRPKHMAWG